MGAAVNGPLLVVHPGADWSTGDVYQGLVPALKRLGVPVVEYPQNAMLPLSKGWLDYLRRRQVRLGGPLKDTKPTAVDVLYHASAQAVERALFFGCSWVLVMTGMYFSLRAVRLLRRAGVKVAVLLTESPYDLTAEFAFAAEADLCWTTERSCLPTLRLACPRTQYLPHAYDPQKHRPPWGEGPCPAVGTPSPEPERRGQMPTPRNSDAAGTQISPFPTGTTPESGLRISEDSVPAHDVVFVGSGFEERIALLGEVDWTGIDFGLYGAWHMLPSRHPLRAHLKGREVDNAYAAALYRKARVGINLFRSSVGHGKGTPKVAGAESLSPRLLELAACGAFTVSEWRPEVGEVFGGCVPTFRDAAGLQSLLGYWLSPEGDQKRAAWARSLPGRVAGRTFDAMARTVVRDLMKADADGEPHRSLEERLGVA